MSGGGRLRALRWTPVDGARPAPGATVTDALRSAVAVAGVPSAPTDRPVRDEAVFLLEAAAEVEHQLLCQYLYAAYSLDDSLADAKAWRETILEIAREEMGHLVTVQNLLLLLGAEPYLDRDDHTDRREFEDFPFPFRLEPLTRASLARYVVAESPAGYTLPAEVVAAAAGTGEIDHVGLLYATIYWLFQATDRPEGPYPLGEGVPFPPGRHLEEDDLVAGSLARQTSRRDWGAGAAGLHVDRVTTRADALGALASIAVQGEGFGGPEESSHFQRFLGVWTELAAAPGPVTLAVPTAPSAATTTDPEAHRWSALFDRRYEALLLDITLGLQHDPDAVADGLPLRRTLLRDWGVRTEMRVGLAGAASRLPLLAREPGSEATARAGAPFGLPALPTAPLDCWRRQLALIDECAQLLAGIDADDERGTLAALRAFDAGRRPFVEARVAEGERG